VADRRNAARRNATKRNIDRNAERGEGEKRAVSYFDYNLLFLVNTVYW
jgi:hypothetical protein